jgi:molybdate transport system substrate-binding protein
MPKIHLLSGGAANGLVYGLQARFLAQTGFDIEGRFGAVGMMKDQLLAGAPCDVVILSETLLAQLTASGHAAAGSTRPLGRVKTGIAVKDGAALVPVDSAAQLRQSLRAATGIYFPDPVKSTAGIHFMSVLRQLGIDAEVAGRLRPYPNGAAAMHAMSQTREPGVVGCTQISEILFAPGVRLAAALPKEFELATVYSAAVCRQAAQPQAAAALIELLTSEEAAPLRSAGGFEPSTA